MPESESRDESIARTLERISRLTSVALVFAGLALLGSAALIGLRVADGHDETAVPPAAGEVAAPTIMVIGRGTVPVVPDTAVVVIGLDGTWPAPADAIQRVDAAVDAVASAGVDPADARVVTYRVTPDASAPASVQVNYRVAVTVRDLAHLDAVLAAASGAGASVFGVGIGVADIPAVLVTARAQAVADARTRAEQLAESLGVTILHADTTEELTSSLPPSPLSLAVVDPAAPSAAATMEVTIEVVVRFAVRDDARLPGETLTET